MTREAGPMLEAACAALRGLETLAAQVEDGTRQGDLSQLLGYAAVAASNLAVVEALNGVVYVANANAI